MAKLVTMVAVLAVVGAAAAGATTAAKPAPKDEVQAVIDARLHELLVKHNTLAR